MKIIADYPSKEMYRTGLEIENQCARCGSSCWVVGDDGVSEIVRDEQGRVTWACLSSPEWCEANPLEGRENVKRGAIEWFTIEEPDE